MVSAVALVVSDDRERAERTTEGPAIGLLRARRSARRAVRDADEAILYRRDKWTRTDDNQLGRFQLFRITPALQTTRSRPVNTGRCKRFMTISSARPAMYRAQSQTTDRCMRCMSPSNPIPRITHCHLRSRHPEPWSCTVSVARRRLSAGFRAAHIWYQAMKKGRPNPVTEKAAILRASRR